MSGDRHLRIVDSGEPNVVPVAGQPDGYAVRDGQNVRALVARDRAGYTVLYGYDPAAVNPDRQWRRSVYLPVSVELWQAAVFARLIAAAYESRVPGWHQLLAAAFDAGPTIVRVAVLHAPVAGAAADAVAVCAGHPEGQRPSWAGCETVKVLAGSLGVVPLPGDTGVYEPGVDV